MAVLRRRNDLTGGGGGGGGGGGVNSIYPGIDEMQAATAAAAACN
jgi:hypothetical protein